MKQSFEIYWFFLKYKVERVEEGTTHILFNRMKKKKKLNTQKVLMSSTNTTCQIQNSDINNWVIFGKNQLIKIFGRSFFSFIFL